MLSRLPNRALEVPVQFNVVQNTIKPRTKRLRNDAVIYRSFLLHAQGRQRICQIITGHSEINQC